MTKTKKLKTKIIKNLKPVTSKYSLLPPYFKLTIYKEYGQHLVELKCGIFVISSRRADINKAVIDIKKNILKTYLDLKKDKKLLALFDDAGEEFLSIVVPKKVKLEYKEKMSKKK